MRESSNSTAPSSIPSFSTSTTFSTTKTATFAWSSSGALRAISMTSFTQDQEPLSQKTQSDGTLSSSFQRWPTSTVWRSPTEISSLRTFSSKMTGPFGWESTSFSESLTSKSSIGTEDYFSPELKLLSLGKRETYPVAAQDVWAIGVVIYEMWNGWRFQRGSRLRWRREPPSDLRDLVESITLSSEQ